MSDYPNAVKTKDDFYTKYIAVSKTAAIKAAGHYATDDIDYILNPYVFEKDKIKSELRLVSALRWSDEKKVDRIEKMARMLDDLEIPYTWNVFTDQKEGTNVNGLIFRHRVNNVESYLQNCDYFVHFSNTESFSYSIIEALSSNLKVLACPLPVYEEIGLKDGENCFLFPSYVFDEGNEEKLKQLIINAYKNKDKKIDYYYDPSCYKKYNFIFYKEK